MASGLTDGLTAGAAEGPAEVAAALTSRLHGGPRRYLLATAVRDVTADPGLAVPELSDDVRRIEELFVDYLGYRRAAGLGVDPTRAELVDALRDFAAAPDRAADDCLVVYLACHGRVAEGDTHYLLLRDTDPDDLYRTGLRASDMVHLLLEGTKLQQVMLIIDACYAQRGAREALADALRLGGGGAGSSPRYPKLVLIASARDKDEAGVGAFTTAFDRAVRGQADTGRSSAFVGLNEVMAALDCDPDLPVWQRCLWSTSPISAGLPLFLPNPCYLATTETDQRSWEEIDQLVRLRQRERLAREQELATHFLPRARGTDVPGEEVWDFTGRHEALAKLTAWLAEANGQLPEASHAASHAEPEGDQARSVVGTPAMDEPQGPWHERVSLSPVMLVTGDPGSGKSAVLGRLQVLADAERRPLVPVQDLPRRCVPQLGSIRTAVHARDKSTRQILDALAEVVGERADSVGALISALHRCRRPLVVVIDSLDEALAPLELLQEVLVPLAESAGDTPLRLLLGARRHIADRLPSGIATVDLDDSQYADPPAVRAYVRTLLRCEGSVLENVAAATLEETTDAIAEAAGRSFLVARITARTVAGEPEPPDPWDQAWRTALPRRPGEALERDLRQRLGDRAGWARDLLVPLAFAHGAGMPAAVVWPEVASELSGRRYTTEDLVELRALAGGYVLESLDDGVVVCRVYHQALVEHLRAGRDQIAAHRAVTRVLRWLTERANRLYDGRSPWRSALPYVRRYLVRHAADGRELDPLLCDAGLVLAVDAEQLFLALPSVRTREGRRAELALRSVEDRLRGVVEPRDEPKARAWLRLAALCTGADRLAQSCDVVPQGMGAPPWRARWAAWNPGERGRRYEELPVDRGVVVTDERPGGEFIGALSMWDSPVAGWDLGSGEASLLERRVSGLVWWNRWEPVPQLGRAAAVLNRDQAFPRDFDVPTSRARKSLDSAALLHCWTPERHRRTTWRLLPEAPGGPGGPGASFADVAVAHQFAVSGAAGKPTFVAVNAPFGIVLFSLTELPAFDESRRAVRRLSKDEREELRRRRADLLGLPTRRLPLRESRVTWLCAPGGLPGGQFLFGYADGAVLHHDAPTGVTTPVEIGHESRITCVTVLARMARPPLVIASAADGSVRAVALPVTPADPMLPHLAEPSRLLLQAGPEICSVAARAHGRDQLLAAVTRDGELHRVDVLSGRPLGRPRQVGFYGTAAVLTALTLDDEPVVAVQGAGRGLQMYEMLSGRRVGGQEPVGPVVSVTGHPGALWVGTSTGVVRELGGDHPADLTTRLAHQGAVVGMGTLLGPAGVAAVVSAGNDGLVTCWDPVTRQELWHTEVPGPPLGFEPTLRVADFRQSASDRAALACGYGGGLVHVLLLRGGIPAGEQEFRVLGPVTAVTLGRACGREVVVATGADGRMHCWDLDAGGWWGVARGPADGTSGSRAADVVAGLWIDSLAVHPDGSGRCYALDGSGWLHSWTLPSGRPLRPPQSIGAEGGRICLVTLEHRTWLVAVLGTDVSVRDADRLDEPPQFRMSARREVTALRALPDGTVLCGDYSGEALLLRFDPDDGWRMCAAVDQPGAGTALAGTADVLAVGATKDEIHVRGVADGHLRGRLSPRCDAGVAELAVVREGQASTGSTPRLSVVGRSDSGLVERWDLSGSPIVGDPTDELLMPAGHGVDAPARFVVFPGKAVGGDRLLSVSGGAYGPDVHEPGAHEPDGPDPRHLGGAYALFPDWPARRPRSVLQRWHRRLGGDQAYRDHFPRRHSVWSRQPDQVSAVWAVRAGGRGLLLAWRGPEWEIDLFDLESHKLLPTRMVFAEPEWEAPALVAALDTPDGPELAVVAGRNLHLYDWDQVSRARRRGRSLEPVRVQELPFAARLGAVVEGGRRVAVANGQRLAVLRLDGAETVDLRLPSICTALTPAGERGVAVGTRNGVVVIDGPQTWL